MTIENLTEYALEQKMAAKQAADIGKPSVLRCLWEAIQHRRARYMIVGVRRQGRLCIRDKRTGIHYLIFAHEIYQNKHILKQLTPCCRRYIEQIALVEIQHRNACDYRFQTMLASNRVSIQSPDRPA